MPGSGDASKVTSNGVMLPHITGLEPKTCKVGQSVFFSVILVGSPNEMIKV